MPAAKSNSIACCTCIWLNKGSTDLAQVFNRTIIDFGFSEPFEGREQGRGFLRFGRPRNDNGATKVSGHVVPQCFVVWTESECTEWLCQLSRVKDSQD